MKKILTAIVVVAIIVLFVLANTVWKGYYEDYTMKDGHEWTEMTYEVVRGDADKFNAELVGPQKFKVKYKGSEELEAIFTFKDGSETGTYQYVLSKKMDPTDNTHHLDSELIEISEAEVETTEQTEVEKEPVAEEQIEEVEEVSVDDVFYIAEISDELFEKMQGKTYKSDCTVPRDDLRYVHVMHVDFDGNDQEGELVCNKKIAEDLLDIFKELYANRYEIEKIRLMDEYDADDETAMRDNNTSCFNFRFISHTTKVSKHGQGIAVDINTLYNPYIKTVDGELILEPATASDYVDRTKDFPHKIDENDLAYKLFTERGFEWGGSWGDRKDYQHFELP